METEICKGEMIEKRKHHGGASHYHCSECSYKALVMKKEDIPPHVTNQPLY